MKPTLDPGAVFDGCVETVADEDLRGRFGAVRDIFLRRVSAYDDAGMVGEFTRIQSDASVGTVQGFEMRFLYSNCLVKNKEPRAKYYDVLKLATPICPFCGHLRVKTLDHYLPKAHFPVFSVAPSNLVPSCRDCNTVKTDKLVTAVEDQVIHPYYDLIPDDVWLYIDLQEGDPPVFLYKAEPPSGWGATLCQRVKKHFEVFELGELYLTQAAEEFGNIKDRVRKLHQEGGIISVRNHLDGEFRSRLANQKNSWQTAFYRSCSESDWFCDIGFQVE